MQVVPARPPMRQFLSCHFSTPPQQTLLRCLLLQMEAVKGAARPRGVRVMVVVVQAPGEGDLPDDRAAMICRQAGVDKK